MIVEKCFNIANYTTMRIPVYADVFHIESVQDIIDYFNLPKKEYVILGGGSNVIIANTTSVENVLKIEIKGIAFTETENGTVLCTAGAGEIWDDVVKTSCKMGYSGIEALCAIPGTAGATPVQNVGAYGREIKDVLVSLRAYDIKHQKVVTLKNEDCHFSYRDSIFKSQQKGTYIILDITMALSKTAPHIPDYPGVKEYFEQNNIDTQSVTAIEIYKAVTDIRWSKLPKPEVLANVGSFFGNPVVDKSAMEFIKTNYPDIKIFDLGNGQYKIPAGALIEKSGLKGKNFGQVGTYEKNALVLVNYGNAQYKDVILASSEIIDTVKAKFGITLVPEPEFIK